MFVCDACVCVWCMCLFVCVCEVMAVGWRRYSVKFDAYCVVFLYMKIRLLVCDKCIDLLHCSSKQVELYTVLPWVELINWLFYILIHKQNKNVKGSVIVWKHNGIFSVVWIQNCDISLYLFNIHLCSWFPPLWLGSSLQSCQLGCLLWSTRPHLCVAPRGALGIPCSNVH